MQNIEYKAELRDMALARSIALAIGARHVGTLDQTDTYFRTTLGRLKKRETVGDVTEWILYHRRNDLKPKLSNFTIFTEEEAADRFGSQQLPPWVTIKKVREVYLLDNVRIHLDRVEGLGEFLEFEAVVRPGKNLESCDARVRQLKADFAPALGEPIAVSYSDMLS